MNQLRVIELVNRNGDSVKLLNLGARLCSLELQMQSGPRNVVLGYPDTKDYVDEPNYMGCTVGRYCNRMAQASFVIDGHRYHLSCNDGIHHLHGGTDGFDRRTWKIREVVDNRSVTFELESPHGDQGYPGNLRASVRYDWNDARELTISYGAETDAPTYVNLTNHAYFNLDGDSASILQHTITIDSDRIVAVDDELIPTGMLTNIENSALDLRQPMRLVKAVETEHSMTRAAGGIDFTYVLNAAAVNATAFSSNQDLALSLHTSCPGLHLYMGQNLVQPMQRFAGFCLEAQYFADSPNHENFPDTLLVPGKKLGESTCYRFIERADATS